MAVGQRVCCGAVCSGKESIVCKKVSCFSFVLVFLLFFSLSTDVAAQGLNVAPAGTATQSTTGYGGVPERAIDGNTNGNWGNSSLSHTAQGDAAPWWQVDLGEMLPLESIVLWNRSDCCWTRLSNFQVAVLDFEAEEVWSDVYYTEGTGYVPADGLVIELPEETEGQIVRIDILGPSTPNGSGVQEMYVSLAEVQVFRSTVGLPPMITAQPQGAVLGIYDPFTLSVTAGGQEPLSYQWQKDGTDIDGAIDSMLVIDAVEKSDAGIYTVIVTNDIDSLTSDPAELKVPGYNLAYIFGLATQSTTGYSGVPERAIDGNTDGIYNNNSVTHTNTGDLAPWWQVDLGGSFPLDVIMLWNRTDTCCISRLSNFQLTVLDDGEGEVWSDAYYTEGTGYVPAEGLMIELPEGTNGQFVRIDLLGAPTPQPDGGTDMFINLAEAQVFSAVDEIAPIVMSQPAGGRVSVEETFQFSVEAFGTRPLEYQWRKDGVDIDGATEATLVLDSVEKDDAGIYEVVVTNTADSVTSVEVELLVFGKNLAVGGQASQSSTNGVGAPGRAIDGNTDGIWNNGSVTHTRYEPVNDEAPWWEVALVGTSTVEMITLWNRTDCCWTRLSNFQVSLLDADREEVFSEMFFTAGVEYPEPGLPFDIPLPPDSEGKYVRVELLGPNIDGVTTLSLAEVQVFGDGPEPPPDPNLARRDGAVATQSSQLGGYSPQLAIDGNFANFTHTAAGVNLPATWQVDLGAMHDIATIVLHNRTSCCGSRLRDITVFILNADGSEVLFESELLNPENELGTFPLGPDKLTVDLVDLTGGTVTGQIVRVVRTPDPDLSGIGDGETNYPNDEANVLSLGEVEVFEEIICPPDGDTHCTGLTLEGPDDGSAGMFLLTATATDDSGDVPFCTFTADNGEDPPLTFGPQRVYSTYFLLPPGIWNVSLAVDDSLACDDEADDAICTVQLDLRGDPDNVAFSGIATQSTNEGNAARAIDGITDGTFTYGSVTETVSTDAAPWWEVDLGQTYELDMIVLWNRTDLCAGCMERLSNFTVIVEDEGRTEVYSEDFFTDGMGFVETIDEGFEIPLPAETEGRFVRIELLGPGTSGETILTLAEVQVFKESGSGAGDFQRGDSNSDGGVNIADAVKTLSYLFAGGDDPLCMDSADANDDGSVNIADAVTVLGYLFSGVASLPEPFEKCGPDPTPDELGACNYPPDMCP